jgi:crotonobetainyl-CoA:carnitine CoA-transferase CaiB-like acyl-CoA transferase
VVANELLVEITHPQAGRMRVPRPVGDFGDVTLADPAPSPGLGQHTDTILEELGFDAVERAELRHARVVE